MGSQRIIRLALFCVFLSMTRWVDSFAPPRSTTAQLSQQKNYPIPTNNEERYLQLGRLHDTSTTSEIFPTSSTRTSLSLISAGSIYYQTTAANLLASDYVSTLTQIADYVSTPYSSFGHNVAGVETKVEDTASVINGLDGGSSYVDWNAQQFLTDLSQQLMDAEQHVQWQIPEMTSASRIPTMPQMPSMPQIPGGFGHFQESLKTKIPSGELLQRGWFYNSNANLAGGDVKIEILGEGDGNAVADVGNAANAMNIMEDVGDGNAGVNEMQSTLEAASNGAANGENGNLVDSVSNHESLQETFANAVNSDITKLKASAQGLLKNSPLDGNSVDHRRFSEFLHGAADNANSVIPKIRSTTTTSSEHDFANILQNFQAGEAAQSLSGVLGQVATMSKDSRDKFDSDKFFDAYEKSVNELAESLSNDLIAANQIYYDSIASGRGLDVDDGDLSSNQMLASTQDLTPMNTETVTWTPEASGDTVVDSASSSTNTDFAVGKDGRDVVDVSKFESNTHEYSSDAVDSASSTSIDTSMDAVKQIVSNDVTSPASTPFQIPAGGIDESSRVAVGDTISSSLKDSTEDMSEEEYQDAVESIYKELFSSSEEVAESVDGGIESTWNEDEMLTKRIDEVSSTQDMSEYDVATHLSASSEGSAENARDKLYEQTNNQLPASIGTPNENSANNVADSMSKQLKASNEMTDEAGTISKRIGGEFAESDSQGMYSSTVGVDQVDHQNFREAASRKLNVGSDGNDADSFENSVANVVKTSTDGIQDTKPESVADSSSLIQASTGSVEIPSDASTAVVSSSSYTSTTVDTPTLSQAAGDKDSMMSQVYSYTQDTPPPTPKFGPFGNTLDSVSDITKSVESQSLATMQNLATADTLPATDSAKDSASAVADALSSTDGSIVAESMKGSFQDSFDGSVVTLSSQTSNSPGGSIENNAMTSLDVTKSLSKFADDSGTSLNEAFSAMRDRASTVSNKFVGSISTKLSESVTTINDDLASAAKDSNSKINEFLVSASSSFTSDLRNLPLKVHDVSVDSINVINKAAVQSKIANSGGLVGNSVDLGYPNAEILLSGKAAAFIGTPDSSLSRFGASSLSDCAEGVLAGVKFIGGIVDQILDVVLQAFVGTSLEQVLLHAQNSVHSLVYGATNSVTSTINAFGSMTVAEVLQNMIYLIIAVSKILVTVVNAVVKLISGKEATEWALVAVNSVNEQAHNLAAHADVLSHKSFSELTASIAEFSQQVGHEVVGIASSLNDVTISGDGVAEKLSSILTALQTSL